MPIFSKKYGSHFNQVIHVPVIKKKPASPKDGVSITSGFTSPAYRVSNISQTHEARCSLATVIKFCSHSEPTYRMAGARPLLVDIQAVPAGLNLLHKAGPAFFCPSANHLFSELFNAHIYAAAASFSVGYGYITTHILVIYTDRKECRFNTGFVEFDDLGHVPLR